MSYELYFKSGWSNKDAGLKRSPEIHCHKKATWLAFGTDNYSTQADIQVQAVAPLRSNALFDSWNSLPTVAGVFQSSSSISSPSEWSHSISFPLSFHFSLFSLLYKLRRHDKRLATAMPAWCSLIKPYLIHLRPPPLSQMHSSLRRSTCTGSIFLFEAGSRVRVYLYTPGRRKWSGMSPATFTLSATDVRACAGVRSISNILVQMKGSHGFKWESMGFEGYLLKP